MTSTTEMGAELLKVDSKGRVQVSEKRREALLEEFDRSGMSVSGVSQSFLTLDVR